MQRTCSQCDSEAVTTMKQQPFCENCGQDKLEELEAKQEVLEAELDAAEKEYERLQDKYDVNSYGHIEHQLNVEGREDIDESDVNAVSDAEDELASTRQELKGIEENIRQLEQGL